MAWHVEKLTFTRNCRTKRSRMNSGDSHIGIQNIQYVIWFNTSGIAACNKNSLMETPKEQKSKNILFWFLWVGEPRVNFSWRKPFATSHIRLAFNDDKIYSISLKPALIAHFIQSAFLRPLTSFNKNLWPKAASYNRTGCQSSFRLIVREKLRREEWKTSSFLSTHFFFFKILVDYKVGLAPIDFQFFLKLFATLFL